MVSLSTKPNPQTLHLSNHGSPGSLPSSILAEIFFQNLEERTYKPSQNYRILYYWMGNFNDTAIH